MNTYTKRGNNNNNVYQNIYNPPYIILETEINFQNAVTFVRVKLDTKCKSAEFLETTYLTTLLAKCNIMRVSRMRLPFLYSYKLSGQVLDEVKDSKYLGVTISDNLDWSKHITTTTTKANARLSFIKRNLKDCPQKLKEIAYFSLVRSFVDYASAVWDPHQKFNQVKLEMVQRRAARFVKSRYKRTDIVTAMLDELGLPILSKRRKDARLILFSKLLTTWHR